MSRIRPSWTPALVGDSGDFTIGHRWTTTVTITVEGAWYYLPPGSSNPPTLVTAILYLESDESVLASGTLSSFSDGWNFIEFTVPFVASAGVGYRTAVQTNGEYGWDDDDLANPITDPDHGVVTIPAGGGAFAFGHGYPDGLGDFMHASDTEFEVDIEPNQGTAAFAIDMELAAEGASGSTGTAEFELNLALTATGTAGERRDTMVLPIAEDLLACLCEAVAEGPNPPASCCLRPGVTVAQGVSEHEDECCEGLAWVRVSRVWPTGSEVGFPAINDDPFNCSPISYGIEMEMGIYRCAPTGDERNLPTCDEWTATTEQILDDAASMRRAWCCFRDNYDNSAKLVGQWIPVMVQGGCTGGTMTIMIESYCTDCVAEGS